MGIYKISRLCVGFLLVLITLTAHANSSTETFFAPYSAVYSTVWKKGISLKVEGKQTLTRESDHLWRFTFTADNFIASLNEQVSFTLQNNQILPQEYSYRSSALGKERKAVLTFDWQKMQVRNDIKNKPWNLSIEPGTLDKLGIQLQVRQDLKLGKKTFDYQIADGGKIKNWRFKRVKIEKIDTKLGNISSIKLVRIHDEDTTKETAFWFAPMYDYLLVKLVHKEDGESYSLDIDSLTTP